MYRLDTKTRFRRDKDGIVAEAAVESPSGWIIYIGVPYVTGEEEGAESILDEVLAELEVKNR